MPLLRAPECMGDDSHEFVALLFLSGKQPQHRAAGTGSGECPGGGSGRGVARRRGHGNGRSEQGRGDTDAGQKARRAILEREAALEQAELETRWPELDQLAAALVLTLVAELEDG